MNNRIVDLPELIKGILSGDRIILAKAITLIESTLSEDQAIASQLINTIMPQTGNAIRIGITGVPGVGKSTFIESFGNLLTLQQKKVAVLTIDPSSQLTKGSILGDKTRMPELSKNPLAFIRPSASATMLGGVASRTREAMLLCEAAGFDIIIVETVGVGQSEVSVKNMVDFFLLLMLAGAGDELQGIKKGIMEMADAVVITKADGQNLSRATEAQADFQHAMHLLPNKRSGWIPKVLTASAIENRGIDDIWKVIEQYKSKTTASGFFNRYRHEQNVHWFHEHFQQLLLTDHLQFNRVKNELTRLNEEIREDNITPRMAAQQLLNEYYAAIRAKK